MAMRHIHTILASIILAIIAFFIGYSISPRMAEAPTAVSPKNVAPGSVIIPISIVSLQENSSSSPSISIEYPQFPSLGTELNAAIASGTLNRLADFRKESADNDAARRATAEPGAIIPANDYSFIASWEPAQVNGRYVSFIERYDSFTGGANENQEVETFDYDVASHRLMALADLFPTQPDYLNEISILVRSQLASSMSTASNGNVPTDMLDAGTAPTAENFSDFTFTDDVVTFYFPKYAVAPGSFGEQKAAIARSEVK